MTDDVFTACNLAAHRGIRHGFFTKKLGSPFLGNSLLPSVVAAKAHIGERLGGTFVCCKQIHSADVIVVETPWDPQDAPKADGLVTRKRGIVLEVNTADCVPVLFADPKAHVIGAAHAGWRGALSGVLENTLGAMEKLGAKRGEIRAALGPCIWQKSYQVGPEFPEPFLAEKKQNERFFIYDIKDGHYLFDLQGYIIEKLKGAGLESVEASPADTCADPEKFFSHRYSTLKGKKREGNLISAIMLT